MRPEERPVRYSYFKGQSLRCLRLRSCRKSAGYPAASPSTDQGASAIESVKQLANSGASEVKEGAENAASDVSNAAKRAYHKGAAVLKHSVLTPKAKAELMRNQETRVHDLRFHAQGRGDSQRPG
jgi:hypothetical protein